MLEGVTLNGRYRLDRQIGGSGNGAVFRATDLQTLGDVAVRVIPLAPGGGREQAAARARFREHATTAAGLRHPNVVTVHEVGTDEPLGLDYVVMELLHGEDLQRRVRRKTQLGWQQVSRILHDAARGLGAGHRVGLVHGGVRPASLFLERDAEGKPLRTRVLDLGTARFTGAGPGQQAGHSSVALPYAAPEQRRGKTDLTPAADVWGLAVAAFEMLTGTLPFTDAQNAALARGVRVQPATVSSLNPSVPASADALIARSLSPYPEERAADGQAFARELEAIRRGGDLADAPAPAPEPEIPAAAWARAPAPEAPLAKPASEPTAVPARGSNRGVRAMVLATGTLVVMAVLSIAVFGKSPSERAAEYFASAAPIAPSRRDVPGEVSQIRDIFERIENGGLTVREWRMELGRFPRYEWPSADSAHATVYEDRNGIQKIRVRVYENGERTAHIFYYDAGALVFVFQVAAAGGGRDAEQRFYFRDRTLIRWRDTRNVIVPLGRGYDEFARQYLRVSDKLLEAVRRPRR